jgi:hypothetical protein
MKNFLVHLALIGIMITLSVNVGPVFRNLPLQVPRCDDPMVQELIEYIYEDQRSNFISIIDTFAWREDAGKELNRTMPHIDSFYDTREIDYDAKTFTRECVTTVLFDNDLEMEFHYFIFLPEEERSSWLKRLFDKNFAVELESSDYMFPLFLRSAKKKLEQEDMEQNTTN